jgi:DNA-binding transcriptional LysR family regulator
LNPLHLRTFLAAARHGSFTRAAEDVFLTQPAVSRQIRQLERELGVALFEQVGKSMHLTDAGRALVAEAERLLGDMERAAEAVQAYRAAERGRLALGASSTPGLYLLPTVIGQFCRRYPTVELHYTVENSQAIERKLLRNEVDLGVVGAAPGAPAILAQPLVDDRIVCFTGRRHPLARRREIDPKSLENETWILRERGAATRRIMESWLARRSLKVGHAIEMSCPEGVKALVAAGVGFSYMSIHGLRRESRKGELRILNVRGMDLRRSLHWVRHVDKRVSPVMQAFIDMATKALASASRRLFTRAAAR